MYFMIDYENTGGQGLKGAEYLEPEDKVIIFYSKSCDKIEYGLLKLILDSKSTLELCRLKKTGKNALDFYITSRLGEIYGGGYDGKAAIVSRDQGFRAVQEYWRERAANRSAVVLNSTIGGCIRTANEDNGRTRTAREALRQVPMEDEVTRYREEERLRKRTKEIFQDTKYGMMEEQVWKLLKEKDCKKNLYLNSLKTFGREDGLVVYRKIRDELLQTGTMDTGKDAAV